MWESFLIQWKFMKSLKFLANFSCIAGHNLLLICSKIFFIKSFVICKTPNRFWHFGKCFVHVYRKQRSSSNHFSTYLQTVRVLLVVVIHLPFANVTRYSWISTVSYIRTKTRRFHKHLAKGFVNSTRYSHLTSGLWPRCSLKGELSVGLLPLGLILSSSKSIWSNFILSTTSSSTNHFV